MTQARLFQQHRSKAYELSVRAESGMAYKAEGAASKGAALLPEHGKDGAVLQERALVPLRFAPAPFCGWSAPARQAQCQAAGLRRVSFPYRL